MSYWKKKKISESSEWEHLSEYGSMISDSSDNEKVLEKPFI